MRRGGRLTLSQKNGLNQLWHQYGIDNNQAPLNFETMFVQPQPIILEVGFGNGDSLLEMASSNTNFNYLGIEVYQAGVGRLICQANKQNLTNIKIIKDDATEVLAHRIQNNTLVGVQIFFPDPWHKKKHHKRRLIQANLLDLLAKKLKPTGFLHIATDWQNYAEHIDLCLNEHLDFKKLSTAPNSTLRPITKFEKRGLKLGHQIWDFFMVKA